MCIIILCPVHTCANNEICSSLIAAYQELIKYKQATEKAAKEQERRAKMSGATQPGDKSTGGAAAGAAPSKSSSKTTKHGSSSSSTERTKAGRSKNH